MNTILKHNCSCRPFQFVVTILLVLTAISCEKQALNLPPEGENNLNLNTLTTLSMGENTLVTQDFILDPREIDSVSSAEIPVVLVDKKYKIRLNVTSETPHFFNINIWIKGVPYAIPCRKTDKVDYVFSFNPQGKTYKKVQIAGQMNDWAPNLSPDLALNDSGLYTATLNISPGTYLYQMALDGDWNHDPNNPNKVDNGYGKFNSILQVAGNSDKFPRLETDKIESGKFTLTTQNNVKSVFAYWQNYLLPADFVKTENGKITVAIPREAGKTARSFVRVWAVNEWGVSNDVLVPLEHGKTLTKSSEITRHDRHAQIMYFMLVDRFKNGNTDNDRPMNRPDVNPKVDFFGGDLAGLQQVINDGYFQKLGVNTLWISPLNQNPDEPYGFYAPMKTKFSGYHGYWPVSFSRVDDRFGSNDELRSLVADAHSKNMNVLLDYVAHHVHEENPLYKQFPQYFTSLYLPDGTLNTERWNDHRLSTWFDTFMPTIDFSNPTVIEMMTDSALFWLNEFKLDGFRHDACKHVDLPFWRTLTKKIKENNQGKNLYQIGETYGSPELINSYLSTGMLDGQFDFNVFEDANTSFAGVGVPDLQRVNAVLQSSLKTYGSHNLMGYISGNHDKPRFMALASGDLKFGEDSKKAGWEREIGITDSTAYDKMALMQTFILTIPGVPVIFYGDEIGLTGANDPDCRRMMKFDGLNTREKQLLEKVTKLTSLRNTNPALVYGDFINLQVTTDTWIFARKYFDKKVLILINNSPQPKELEIEIPANLQGNFKANFGSKFTLKDGKLKVSLPKYGSEILN
ncbi:MAG: alpha-amylase [Porphyromonadaceae bacterium]|nr:alpha-amylase [Porphyromonadaceae bacterium]